MEMATKRLHGSPWHRRIINSRSLLRNNYSRTFKLCLLWNQVKIFLNPFLVPFSKPYFFSSVAQLFDTANYMYILPAHRATVYIMGVLLGYFLRKYKDTGLKLTPKQINLGWLISFIAVCVSFFGPSPMGNINYVYNPVHAALYAAYAPIGWCIGFGWIIFTSHLGYKCKPFCFFMKLTIFRDVPTEFLNLTKSH